MKLVVGAIDSLTDPFPNHHCYSVHVDVHYDDDYDVVFVTDYNDDGDDDDDYYDNDNCDTAVIDGVDGTVVNASAG